MFGGSSIKKTRYLRGHHLSEISTEAYLEMATAAGVSCSELNSDIVEKIVEECKGFITTRLHSVLKAAITLEEHARRTTVESHDVMSGFMDYRPCHPPFLFPDQLPFDEHLPYEMMKLMELGFTEQISQLIFAKPQQINIWLTEIHRQRLGTGCRATDCILTSDIPNTDKILLLQMLPDETFSTTCTTVFNGPNGPSTLDLATKVFKPRTSSTMDSVHADISIAELALRTLLAQDDIRNNPPDNLKSSWRDHSIIKNIFNVNIDINSGNNNPPCPPGDVLLSANRTNMRGGIVGKAKFMENWRTLTGGAFNNMDWDHLFVAGGAVLGCLLPDFEAGNGFSHSDIDIFVHGVTIKEANDKLASVLLSIANQTGLHDIVVSKHAVTIVGVRPFRHLQVVLRIYISPLEILSGFDVDSCCVGFDGENVWATQRAIRSITDRINIVDLTRRSPTYEHRLKKYAKRGFAVVVPGLNLEGERRKRAHGRATRNRSMRSGLVTLLVADGADKVVDHAFENLKQAPHLQASFVHDYGFFPLAGGAVVSHDVLDAFYLQSSDGRLQFGNDTTLCKLESFYFISDIDSDDTDYEFRKSDDKKKGLLPFIITWLTENPGKQGLLSGSFQPIEGELDASFWSPLAWSPEFEPTSTVFMFDELRDEGATALRWCVGHKNRKSFLPQVMALHIMGFAGLHAAVLFKNMLTTCLGVSTLYNHNDKEKLPTRLVENKVLTPTMRHIITELRNSNHYVFEMPIRQEMGEQIRSIKMVLMQVHPDMGISLDGVTHVLSILNRLAERMINVACQVTITARTQHRKSIDSRAIQTATRLVLPGELAKHAISEGVKAVTKFSSSYGEGTKSQLAGLSFNVDIYEEKIRRGFHGSKQISRVGGGAPVYLAAVMEYISAEILELAGHAYFSTPQRARDLGVTGAVITPFHISIANDNDEELSSMIRCSLGLSVSRALHEGYVLPIKVQYKKEGKTKGESKEKVVSSISGVNFDDGINQLMDIQAFSFYFTNSCEPGQLERKTDISILSIENFFASPTLVDILEKLTEKFCKHALSRALMLSGEGKILTTDSIDRSLVSIGASVDGAGIISNKTAGFIAEMVLDTELNPDNESKNQWIELKSAARVLNAIKPQAFSDEDDSGFDHAILSTTELIVNASNNTTQKSIGLVLTRLSRIINQKQRGLTFRHIEPGAQFSEKYGVKLRSKRASEKHSARLDKFDTSTLSIFLGGQYEHDASEFSDLATLASHVNQFWFHGVDKETRENIDADANFDGAIPLISCRRSFQQSINNMLPISTKITFGALRLLQESTETLIHSIISELNNTITSCPHSDGDEATLLFTMFVKSIESHGLLTDFITPTHVSVVNKEERPNLENGSLNRNLESCTTVLELETAQNVEREFANIWVRESHNKCFAWKQKKRLDANIVHHFKCLSRAVMGDKGIKIDLARAGHDPAGSRRSSNTSSTLHHLPCNQCIHDPPCSSTATALHGLFREIAMDYKTDSKLSAGSLSILIEMTNMFAFDFFRRFASWVNLQGVEKINKEETAIAIGKWNQFCYVGPRTCCRLRGIPQLKLVQSAYEKVMLTFQSPDRCKLYQAKRLSNESNAATAIALEAKRIAEARATEAKEAVALAESTKIYAEETAIAAEKKKQLADEALAGIGGATKVAFVSF